MLPLQPLGGERPMSWTLRPRGVLRAAALLLAAHVLFYLALLRFDAIDDAYISFRYARNLAQGFGAVFNPGERVEGYTNFLWMLLDVPAELAHLPPRVWALGLSVLLGFVGLLATYRLAAGLLPWAGAIAALLLAADGSYALWSVSGMETPLFGFLVLLGAACYLRESDMPLTPTRLHSHTSTRGWVSGVVFALAALTRPEGVLMLGLTCLHQALGALRWQGPRGRRMLGQALVRGVVFGAIYLPYFLWRWRYYGFFFPNTYYDKVGGDSEGGLLARGLLYLQHFAGLHFYFLPLLLVLVPLWRGAFRREIGYLLLLFLATCGYIVYVGGDWSVGRFFAPVLPFYYALVGLGVAAPWPGFRHWLQRRLPLQQDGRVLARMVAGLAVVYSLVFTDGLGEFGLFVLVQDAGPVGVARTAAGRWLARTASPTALLAVDAAGQVPYYSGLRTVDLYGLTDATMAHARSEQMGKVMAGHDKFNLPYVLDQRPDYFMLYHEHPGLLPPEYEQVPDSWAPTAREAETISIYKRKGP